jgi:hypothetical protein
MLVPVAPKHRELTTRWSGAEVADARSPVADDVLAQMTCFRDPTFCGAAVGSPPIVHLGQ